MNLLIVMPSGQSRGGAEEALLQIARRHGELSFAMHIVFLEGGDLVPRMSGTGVSWSLLEAGRLRDPLRLVKTILAIRRMIREMHFDAVVGWMTKAHLYGG